MAYYMEKDRVEKIKNAVKKNFNNSPDQYINFENKYRLFEFLTRNLAESCGIHKNYRILDIGCGTGASSFVLSKYSNEKIIGIDFSEKMIESANIFKNKNLDENIEFLVGDADQFSTQFDFKFDLVLYNASIFLMPNPEKTLNEAYSVLLNKGKIGFNILKGVEYNKYDLFEIIRKKSPELCPTFHKPIIKMDRIFDVLKNIGYIDIKKGIIKKPMIIQEIKEFYYIPAMSASLFPKLKYKDRILRIIQLFEFLENEGIDEVEQVWIWFVGEK